jgi:hypothetical protein
MTFSTIYFFLFFKFNFFLLFLKINSKPIIYSKDQSALIVVLRADDR